MKSSVKADDEADKDGKPPEPKPPTPDPYAELRAELTDSDSDMQPTDFTIKAAGGDDSDRSHKSYKPVINEE